MAVMLRNLRSLLLLAGMTLMGLPLTAQSGTPLPEVPEATKRFSETQGCVEPTEDMRKNHMKMMLHKRDQTMHEGIRTPQHSLEECINCHVPAEDSGKIVRIDSKEHFCNSCHTYAAVNIDCFQCHADRPVKKTEFHPLVAKPSPHHAEAISTGPASNGSVSTGTLEVLAEEGKLQ
jgi:hypothetical protein